MGWDDDLILIIQFCYNLLQSSVSAELSLLMTLRTMVLSIGVALTTQHMALLLTLIYPHITLKSSQALWTQHGTVIAQYHRALHSPQIIFKLEY